MAHRGHWPRTYGRWSKVIGAFEFRLEEFVAKFVARVATDFLKAEDARTCTCCCHLTPVARPGHNQRGKSLRNG
jgi:hypothetical protein